MSATLQPKEAIDAGAPNESGAARIARPAIGVHAKYIAVIGLVVALFFWKILFTKQFSLLLGWEAANQAYAWYNFAAHAIQQGVLPLWDPFTFSGRSYIGEMQTGLFYPLKLLLYLAPFDSEGLLSERIYNQAFVLAHFLGAVFMYRLAIAMRLRPASAMVSGISFSLAGFIGRVHWPNMLDAGIWLPLILLYTHRAVESHSRQMRVANAAFGGAAFGVSILAGSLHVAIMEAIVVIAYVGYCCFPTLSRAPAASPARTAGTAFSIAAIIAVFAFAVGSIQLLPSMEYSRLSYRWLSAAEQVPSDAKISYDDLSDQHFLPPRSVFAFVFGYADIGSAEVSPYFGVLPFMLALFGAWRAWHSPWVRFGTGLGAAAFLYAMGSFSFLHGVLYLVPVLDLAREAGRFVYLTHFALAILAGFGMDALQCEREADRTALEQLVRLSKWISIFFAAAFAIPAALRSPLISEWMYFSAVVMALAFAALAYMKSMRRCMPWLILAVTLFDLQAFNWTVLNKAAQKRATGRDFLELARNTKPIAEFLKARGGLFRVRMEGPDPPNIGDIGAVDSIRGNAVTMVRSYVHILESSKADDLLNVQYIVTPGTREDLPLIFTHGALNVYERSSKPRVWLVYHTLQEANIVEAQKHIAAGDVDPFAVGLVEAPLNLAASPDDAAGTARILTRSYNELTAEIATTDPALAVFSETYYPGWHATVNGQLAEILRVDGGLRGIVVQPGRSAVRMTYRPRSVRAGALLGLIACLAVVPLVFIARQSRYQSPVGRAELR